MASVRTIEDSQFPALSAQASQDSRRPAASAYKPLPHTADGIQSPVTVIVESMLPGMLWISRGRSWMHPFLWTPFRFLQSSVQEYTRPTARKSAPSVNIPAHFSAANTRIAQSCGAFPDVGETPELSPPDLLRGVFYPEQLCITRRSFGSGRNGRSASVSTLRMPPSDSMRGRKFCRRSRSQAAAYGTRSRTPDADCHRKARIISRSTRFPGLDGHTP